MIDRGFFHGKRVCIVGAAGSFGRAATERLLGLEPALIRAIDIDENGLFELSTAYRGDVDIRFCDIRCASSVRQAFTGIDVVVHAAALKHVAICESSPIDAVRTNIEGTMNIIEAARERDVGYVLFTSSDKAVHPTSAMGASKLLGERLMVAANEASSGPRFVTTRFGNVLGTRGSVVPIFRRQISRGERLTVRDARMTRFFMSLGEAATLVLDGLALARGGEIFIMKMPVVRILDLAEVMIDELAEAYDRDAKAVGISFVGALPGEKLHEELMSEQEAAAAIETATSFVLVPGQTVTTELALSYGGALGAVNTVAYGSGEETPLTKHEIRACLYEMGVLVAEPSRIGPAVAASYEATA
jgi:FlaA1/EpsC-like NDP-sugar epimerase